MPDLTIFRLNKSKKIFGQAFITLFITFMSVWAIFIGLVLLTQRPAYGQPTSDRVKPQGYQTPKNPTAPAKDEPLSTLERDRRRFNQLKKRRSILNVRPGEVNRLLLTADVFAELKSSPYIDLAVFNKEGLLTPFQVRPVKPLTPPTAAPIAKTTEKSLYLPIFRPPPSGTQDEKRTTPLKNSEIEVTYAGPDGGRLRVKGGGLKPTTSAEKRFILDISPFSLADNETLQKLTIYLGLAGQEDVMAKATLLGSNYLSQWRTLSQNQTLARLKNADASLNSSSLTLPKGPVPRYLLLKIDDLPVDLNWAQLTAQIETRETLTLKKERIEDDKAVFSGQISPDNLTVVYDTKGDFPVKKIWLKLLNPYMAETRLEGARDLNSPWRKLADVTLFLVQDQGQITQNEPLELNADFTRFFRLVFKDQIHETPPELWLYWSPLEVVFMAQGPGPYALAYGGPGTNPSIQGTTFLANLLSNSKGDEPMAALGQEIIKWDWTLELPPREPPTETKEVSRYLVWGLLLFAAILFTGVAFHLLKKDQSPPSPKS
ncbi:MAG: DUF3999 domain-containing protein [Deltaproteobacteria bacterium]|nr:DUF3999 domain-containing protein [Deltaproteobacteria bacterium]